MPFINNSRKIILYTSSLIILGASGGFPGDKISSGILRVGFYYPDKETGYYRGTRFDWSGIMPDIEFENHHFTAQWFEKYEPTIHDAVMGPVESFSPLGLDSANQTGSFVVIGVGRLKKKDSLPYSPFQLYDISDGGRWTVKKQKDHVEFVQKLTGVGHSYDYTKTCLLVHGKPEIILAHTLVNTGRIPIETEVYDHNFFSIDSQPTGPLFEIKFPFPLKDKKEGQGLGSLARVDSNRIHFERVFEKKEIVYTVFEGYGKSSDDYHIQIENHKTGAAIDISSDQPLAKLVFWACSTAICPEPFIHLKINPGSSFSWNIKYKFYSCPILH